MNQQEIYELCKRAFIEEKIPELFRGEEPYNCPVGAQVPALIPTDWESILRSGVYPLCVTDATGISIARCRKALGDMLKGDILDIWCAYNVYFYGIYIEKESQREALVVNEAVRAQISQAVYRHREALKNCKLWQGKWEQEGLWGDISHADRALQQRWQMGVL